MVPCRAAAGQAAAGPSRSAGGDELERLRQENAALRAALRQAALGGVADEELREMEVPHLARCMKPSAGPRRPHYASCS